MKIRSTTSLQAIQKMVNDDFGIHIGKAAAHAIREAHNHNTLLWDSTKLVTLDYSRIRIVRTEEGRIENSEE